MLAALAAARVRGIAPVTSGGGGVGWVEQVWDYQEGVHCRQVNFHDRSDPEQGVLELGYVAEGNNVHRHDFQ